MRKAAGGNLEKKPVKLIDERGLFLLVTPAGGKWWRLKYRFDGKETLLSLGVYPDVPLTKARDKRDELRRQIAQGIDPSAHRKAAKAAKGDANSFESIAREWYSEFSPKWSQAHSIDSPKQLDGPVLPNVRASATG